MLSEFNGIKICIYWDDHMPPHVHALCGSFSAIIDIQNAVVLQGVLPASKVKLVLAWCELHKQELMECWKKVEKKEMPSSIKPL